MVLLHIHYSLIYLLYTCIQPKYDLIHSLIVNPVNGETVCVIQYHHWKSILCLPKKFTIPTHTLVRFIHDSCTDVANLWNTSQSNYYFTVSTFLSPWQMRFDFVIHVFWVFSFKHLKLMSVIPVCIRYQWIIKNTKDVVCPCKICETRQYSFLLWTVLCVASLTILNILFANVHNSALH